MWNNDDYLAKPSLSQAIFANPLKSILLFGAAYAAGAMIGKDRSVQALNQAGDKVITGARRGVSFAQEKIGGRRSLPLPSAPSEVGAANKRLPHYY